MPRCPEEKEKSWKLVFGAAHTAHESRMGRNWWTDPTEAGVLCPWMRQSPCCVVLLAVTLLQARLQESLRCFFCSWYSVIFRWKYAVGEERWLVRGKRWAAQSWEGRCTPGAKLCWVMGNCGQVRTPGKSRIVAVPPHPSHLPKTGFIMLG